MANITSQNFTTYLSSRVGSRNKTYYAQGGFPQVNAFYGTYDSLTTAHKTLCAAYGDFEDFETITAFTPCTEIPRAFTVAVEDGNDIIEYQYKKQMPVDGYTAADLQQKGGVVEVINNLTSTDTTKPLSALQGKNLKDSLDGHDDRIAALEADKNASLVNQITASVTVTPARFYKGVSTTVAASGTISLPSGIPTSKVSAISITDNNGHTDSGSNKTSVSVSDISTNATTITFTLTGSIASPFTKSITKTASCTACNPVYVGTVASSVTTAEGVYAALASSSNLVYSSGVAVSTLNGFSKSITYNNTKLAVICGDSSLSAKGASQLAAYPWSSSVNGATHTVDGITYNVYLADQPQSAHTDTVKFSL